MGPSNSDLGLTTHCNEHNREMQEAVPDAKRRLTVDWTGRQIETISPLDTSINFARVQDAITYYMLSGSREGIAEVLQSGPWTNHTVTDGGYKGRSFMNIACESRNVQAVELLILYGADVNKQDSTGMTPLQQARAVGCKEIMALLNASGAKEQYYEKVANTGKRICFGSAPRISISPLETLPEKEMKKKILESICWSHERSLEALERALASGPWVNEPIKTSLHNGRSFLSLACQMGNCAAVKKLIQYGAWVNTRDSSGLTPLQFAERKGFRNIVRLLREHMCVIDAC